MFAKLLKQEWNASRRTLGILTLAVLGLGLAAIVILRMMASLDAGTTPIHAVVLVALSMVLVFMALGAAIYGVATQFLLLYRFYRHKFTDEGYLTFTLPATPRQLFLSSYVNMLLWMLISFGVITAAVFLAGLFGPVSRGLINRTFLVAVGEILGSLAQEQLLLMAVLPTVVSLFCAPLIGMSCITLGATFAKKHKLLVAFVFYYAYSALSGVVSTVLTFMVSLVSVGLGESYLYLSAGLQTFLMLGVSLIGSAFSIHLMKYKLNLP